ncbi:MAG: hypothetical protein BA864_14580 [Desulfuromonadales bacterium C00003093]|nr:MAG: hypothetical protein BA864_14580 [Desulfuromonadales bacterium C00003093]
MDQVFFDLATDRAILSNLKLAYLCSSLKQITIRHIILFTFAILISAILVEVIYFHHIMSKKAPLRRADLIVVFAGSSERIEPAYRLANSGYARYLRLCGEESLRVCE